MSAYVSLEEGVYRVAGSRVSLDSVVECFREGLSPESIADCLPSLTLEQVFGAIAYYSAHQAEVDAYLRAGYAQAERERERSERANADLLVKLREHRAAPSGGR